MPEPVEIIMFQDPVARAIMYLGKFLPIGSGPFIDVPAGWAWGKTLVTVVDTGGSGERDIVFDDTRLTVEISDRDSVVASDLARKLHGLIRAWPHQENGVRFLRTIMRPTFSPDDETRTPAYMFTVELSFRASTENVAPI